MLKCTKCGGNNLDVSTTRNSIEKTNYLWRRRNCLDCKIKFTSREFTKEDHGLLTDELRLLKKSQKKLNKTIESQDTEIVAIKGKLTGKLLSASQACLYLFGENNAKQMRKLQGWRHNGGGPDFISLSHQSKFYRRTDIDAWLKSKVSEQ